MILREDDVNGILKGRKTQYRIPIEPPPLCLGPGPNGEADWPHIMPEGSTSRHPFDTIPMICPLGAVGDILWVKERWRKRLAGIAFEASTNTHSSTWKDASSLPKGLSRISLKITSLRAERLQQITEADAIAEGAMPMALIVNKPSEGVSTVFKDNEPEPYRRNFLHSWEDRWFGSPHATPNPMVWVITFSRIK